MLVIQDKQKIEALGVLLLFGFVLIGRMLLLSSVHTNGVWEWWLLTIGLLFVLPFFIVKYIFQLKLDHYNLVHRLSWKQWSSSLAIVLGCIVFVDWLMIQLGVENYLTISAWVLGGLGLTLIVDVLLLPVAVLATEFFFRGVLMGAFQSAWGRWPAVAIQTMCATLYGAFLVEGIRSEGWTIGNGTKILLLLVTNGLLGYVAARTRSVYVSAAGSWLIIVATDLLLLYRVS